MTQKLKYPTLQMRQLGKLSRPRNTDTLDDYLRGKEALGAFEEAVGGREELGTALSSAQLDQRQSAFLEALLDPMRTGDSLAKICVDTGMSAAGVIDLFRQGAVARATAIAAGRLSDHLPAVVDDVAAHSVDKEVTCRACGGRGGKGEADEFVECSKCFGSGQVVRQSDVERQKLMFEASGLIKKGGMSIQVNQGVVVGAPASLFSQFVKASDEAAYDVSPEDVIDVEES